MNQRVASGLLGKRGHHVTVVGDGAAAVAALETGTFDLVLMDVQMPEMDGFEATAEIRRREQTTGGHMRIIAMTAHAMAGDRDRCLRAGMDGYVSKPLDPRLLCAVVEQEDATPATVLPPTFEREAALERLGGDAALLSEVIQLFIEDCPARIAAIKAAVDAKDGAAIAREAHALEGRRRQPVGRQPVRDLRDPRATRTAEPVRCRRSRVAAAGRRGHPCARFPAAQRGCLRRASLRSLRACCRRRPPVRGEMLFPARCGSAWPQP